MSAHEFTPGPWSFVPSIPEEGFECFWIENGGQRITAVDGPQTVEREANARLIAAAPELLEALRDVIGWVPSRASFHTDAAARAVERAISAIAKATGEQP